MSNDFVSGDTGSKLRVTVRNASDSSAVDLTGATVTLKWRSIVTDAIVEKTMSLVTAGSGVVEYQFGVDELEKGAMNFEVKIVDSLGKVLRSLDLIPETVREALA